MVQNFEDFANLLKFANFADIWLKSRILAKLHNLLELLKFAILANIVPN